MDCLQGEVIKPDASDDALPRFSLCDGRLHPDNRPSPVSSSNALAIRDPMTVAKAGDVESAAAYFLSKRTFKGMDRNAEKTETEIMKGRPGRAAEYQGERLPVEK